MQFLGTWQLTSWQCLLLWTFKISPFIKLLKMISAVLHVKERSLMYIIYYWLAHVIWQCFDGQIVKFITILIQLTDFIQLWVIYCLKESGRIYIYIITYICNYAFYERRKHSFLCYELFLFITLYRIPINT